MVVSLSVFQAEFLNFYLKDKEFLELCLKCGYQENIEKVITHIIAEIKNQIDLQQEKSEINLLDDQWEVIFHILSITYNELNDKDNQEPEEYQAEALLIKNIINEIETQTVGIPPGATVN